jgi:ABC-type multidrug transport system fused ATPase/permease subunit
VLTIPFLTGRAIDATQPGHRDRSALMLNAGLIVVAGALQGVLMFWRRFLAGRLSLAVEYDLRNAMYRHLQRLSFGFYDRHQTGQLMSRATVDLPLDQLGSKVILPPWLESDREAIEARLTPLPDPRASWTTA